MSYMRISYIILLLILCGCVKCPDSVSFYPELVVIQEKYNMDGIHFSTTWYLPIDNKNLCNIIRLRRDK